MVVQQPVVQFGAFPVTTKCSSYETDVVTSVNSSIKALGWVWCLACCFCGIWIFSFFSCCLSGFRYTFASVLQLIFSTWYSLHAWTFRRFTHKCPRCLRTIAVVEPKFNSVQVSNHKVNIYNSWDGRKFSHILTLLTSKAHALCSLIYPIEIWRHKIRYIFLWYYSLNRLWLLEGQFWSTWSPWYW